ncbi:MAG: hypothetical protein NC339_03135 [Muribaculaceae bacterium]|nr:hypothetical protein [Muribaculaceae bacterium]
MNKNYSDIIGLTYEGVKKHPRMTMEARAAQFAPFAALTGHEDVIAETARTTSSRLSLSADELQMLTQRLSYACSFAEPPLVSITYFQSDSRKQGGAYVTVKGSIKRIEECLNQLILTDNTVIPLDAISDIDGDIFRLLFEH